MEPCVMLVFLEVYLETIHILLKFFKKSIGRMLLGLVHVMLIIIDDNWHYKDSVVIGFKKFYSNVFSFRYVL